MLHFEAQPVALLDLDQMFADYARGYGMSTAAVPVIEALEVVRFTGGWSVGIEACRVRSSLPGTDTSAVSGEIEAQLGLPPLLRKAATPHPKRPKMITYTCRRVWSN